MHRRKRDLRGDGGVTRSVESLRAELGLDPDFRQSVAELDVIACLATLRAIGPHIAAIWLLQRIGFATAFTHSPPSARPPLIGGVERSVPYSSLIPIRRPLRLTFTYQRSAPSGE